MKIETITFALENNVRFTVTRNGKNVGVYIDAASGNRYFSAFEHDADEDATWLVARAMMKRAYGRDGTNSDTRELGDLLQRFVY